MYFDTSQSYSSTRGPTFAPRYWLGKGFTTTATHTATGMSLRCIPWYQVDTPVAATHTELSSMMLRDTLVNKQLGIVSTMAVRAAAPEGVYWRGLV
jgi:hypothetical protein